MRHLIVVLVGSILTPRVRDWRDHGWTGVGSVKNGLEEPVRHQRFTLFGLNVIEIEGKSIISLLLDEVGPTPCVALNPLTGLG